MCGLPEAPGVAQAGVPRVLARGTATTTATRHTSVVCVVGVVSVWVWVRVSVRCARATRLRGWWRRCRIDLAPPGQMCALPEAPGVAGLRWVLARGTVATRHPGMVCVVRVCLWCARGATNVATQAGRRRAVELAPPCQVGGLPEPPRATAIGGRGPGGRG